MSIEQKYKVLDEIDHILARPGMYIGSVKPHTVEEWILDNDSMVYRQVTYNPGIIKVFSEILDNSIDEHKRPNSKLDVIKVNIHEITGEISVWDNGGIPVVKHKVEKDWLPTILFSQLRAGSNFNDDDDQSLIGTNGVGSALTNVMSKEFEVVTADGKNKFSQQFYNNMRQSDKAKISKSSKKYTQITMLPDYNFFGLTGLSRDNYKKIVKRVYDSAGCNQSIKFYINDTLIRFKSFNDYCKLYDNDVITDEENGWSVGVGKSDNGFQHVSFVNSVETYDGGNHVINLIDQITAKLRVHFKKKHKVDVKPADIRNHMTLYVSATINRPMFSSQTKSKMISEPKDFKSSFTVNDKFIAKIIKSEIIQDVLDWVMAKQDAADMAALRKLNKDNAKNNPRRIAKFSDAASKNNRHHCMLFLTEGESASAAIQASRDPKVMGVYPLRGKPLNVNGVDPKKLIKNQEFSDLMTILGLRLGEEVKDKNSLYFGKIVLLVDADCVHEDTIIMTDRGEIKISDLHPDDKVLSHSGKYNRVLNYTESTKTESINLIVDGDTICVSSDHRMMVYCNEVQGIVEKRSKDITSRDKLLKRK